MAKSTSDPQRHLSEPELTEDTWKLYEDMFKDGDRAFIKGWDKDLNTLLLFATLFSAMVTAFVLESYKSLEPTSDDSADLRTSPSVLSSTNPRTVAVRVNVFWFSSLVASVSTAFLAVLTKEWLSDLLDGRNDPHIGTRGRRLQHCHDSVQSWRLSQLLPFLPFLLHISFLLFFAGLVTFLWYIDRTVAIFAAVLVCAMTFVYCWTHVQSILSPSCPYKTSLTSLILSSAGSLWTVFVWHIPAFLAKMWVVIAMVRRSRKYGDHQFVHVAWDVVVMSWFRGWWKRSIPALRDALPASEGIMPPEVTALGPANIFRLREDEFLSENATLLNARALARILIVLRHPRTRLRVDDKRLSLALKELCSFPALVRHRSLFIHAGAIKLLTHQLSNQSSGCSVSDYGRTLVRLLTEADHEGHDARTITFHIRGIPVPWDIRLQRLPRYIPYNFRPEDALAQSGLFESMDFMAQPQEQSPAGISDIVLFSHVLRLRLVRQVPSGIHKASGGADLGHEERVGDLVEQFYDELLSARVSGMLAALVDVDDNLISLVNTIIYIGMSRRNLNIVSRFRTGADSRFISRSLHIMATLITIRPDMGYPVLRQICWGIWMLSMPTSKILSGLLVPVVQSTTELAPSLSELLRLDREGETSFCYAALGLLDYTIWWEMEHHHQLLSANPTSLGVELKEAAELRDALLDKYIALLNSLMSLQSPAIATKGNPSLNPEGPEQWTKQMLQPFRTYFKSRVATRTTARPLPGSGGADAAQAAGVSLPKHSTLTRVRFTRHVLRICGSALELKRRHSKLPISRWQDVLRTSCYYLARLTTDLNRLPSSLDERGRVSGLWSDGELVFLRVVLVKFTGWVIRSCLRRGNEQPAEHATAHDMSFIDDLLLRQDHSIAPNPETLVADIASSIEAAYNIVTDAQKYLTILSLRQSAWTIGAFLTCLEGLLTEARLHQPVQVALRSYFKRQNPQDDDQSHSPMRMIMHLDFTISGELRGHAEQESSGGWPPFNLTEACFKAIRVDLHNMAGSGDKFSSHRGDADRAANSSHPPTSPILDSLEAGGATNERSNVP